MKLDRGFQLNGDGSQEARFSAWLDTPRGRPGVLDQSRPQLRAVSSQYDSRVKAMESFRGVKDALLLSDDTPFRELCNSIQEMPLRAEAGVDFDPEFAVKE